MINSKSLGSFVLSARFLKPFIATVVGAIGGFLYYYFIGCTSGTCPITGNPYISTVWGGLLGFFLINSPCSRGKC